jgi:hypothetical protein
MLDCLKGGYLLAAITTPEEAARRIFSSQQAWRGVLCEGAAMSFMTCDLLTRSNKRRFSSFATGPAGMYKAMLYAGSGMAIARLRQPLVPAAVLSDRQTIWPVINGYAFYHGFFNWPVLIEKQLLDDWMFQGLPPELNEPVRHVFDQGLGRSIWFLARADQDSAERLVSSFSADRKPRLWSGIGLAATYTGSDSGCLLNLASASGQYIGEFATGLALAARIQLASEDRLPQLEAACQAIWHRPAASVLAVTEAAFSAASGSPGELAYINWQNLIAERFRQELVR